MIIIIIMIYIVEREILIFIMDIYLYACCVYLSGKPYIYIHQNMKTKQNI